MPIEMIILAYTFAELSDKAKQHAVQRCGEPHDVWWDSVYEMYKEDGKALGFDIEDIRFSGFWSQGDGASWSGRVDMKVYFERQLADAKGAEVTRLTALVALIDEGTLSRYLRVTRAGLYSHEHTMQVGDIEVCGFDYDVVTTGPLAGASEAQLLERYLQEPQDIEKEILEAARDYAREIHHALETEYDYQTSEAYFAEMAEANDWKFDEDGVMV